jgi:peptide/nickel transport system substrate-binding protein
LRTQLFSSKLIFLFVALFLIASLMVAGCSTKTTTSPASTTAKPATTPAATTPAATTPAATTPAATTPAATTTTAIKKGGTLKIIYEISPNAIGYGPAIVRNDDILAASPCVEALFHVDSDGAVAPWLATSLKTDATTNVTLITLRQGVKFHDGTPFDAEACKWNLELYLAQKRVEMRSIQSIDVVDPYTVRLNCSTFDNTLGYSFTQYVGLMISPTYFKAHGEEGTKNHPVGTGPFKFVSFQRDVNLKYTRFDGYWQEGKPYLDNVEFVYITDPMVRLASFQAGEGDTLLALDAKDAESFEATGKYAFNKCLGGLWGLTGDGSHDTSPFANLKVRQAIEYAINREPVVQAIGRGYYEATDQSCAKGSWGYNPAPSPYSYDPTKAKALLAEAGYPNGLGGLPLTIQNAPASGVDFYTAILEQLNNAGFDLYLDVVDPAKFGEYVIKTGWNNTLLGWNYTEFADSSSILVNGWSSFGFPYRSVLHPPEIDDAIRLISQATDFETKKALVQKVNGLIRDKYCNVTTLCRLPGISIRNKAVHDDGFYTTVSYQQTLQDCWLDR